MRRSRAILGSGLLAGAALFAARPVAAQQREVHHPVEPDQNGFVVAQPNDLAADEGGRMKVLVGNPSKPGIYTIRITWAPGQGSHPHYHDQGRYITVLKGHWYVSTGPEADVYDPDHMKRVDPGTFIYEPPMGHHYDMAKDEEVVVQITGMGPVKTIPIRPESKGGGQD